MFDTRPYALIVDRDGDGRAALAALLRENGFVVAAFRETRGALAALSARPVDIVVIVGEAPDGEDALAAARQLRHDRPGSKVLFAGSVDAMPAAPGPDSGRAVTRPFDKRRFLGAVFELLSRGGDIVERRDEAEMGLMAARLACLRSRQTGWPSWTAVDGIARQTEMMMAARQALRDPPGSA